LLVETPLTFVDDFETLQEFWRWLGERRPILAIDIETTGLSLARDRIRLMQFGDGAHGWAIPWDLYNGVAKEALARYDRPMVGHHVKFDVGFLARAGARVSWTHLHDTLPMCFLLNSAGPKSLKAASGHYVDPAARAGQHTLKALMARNRWTWATIPVTNPIYWGYASGDTVLTALLAEKLWPLVQPYRQAYDLELACERVLCEMELRGVRIDVPYCEAQLGDLEVQLEKLLLDLEPLNPNAPHQVAAALESFGVHLTKRTKAGKQAVDDEVLSALVRTAPDPVRQLAARVSEARDVQKLVSAFFGNFLRFRDGDLLHPHFNQLAARTGRMSVSEPALQQVPKQAMVRDAFIPRDGNRLVVADYDNQEVRLAAHFSRDPALLAAFAEDPPRDLHADTARRVYGVETPSSDQRAVGKRAFFALSYGAGVPKFALTTGLSEADAAQVFNAIGELYPGLKAGMATATRRIRSRASAAGTKTGWIQLGDTRKLHVPTDAAYKGWNFLIQGTGASVMKQALVDLDRVGLGDYLNLTVHDEVQLDVPEPEAQEAARVTVETLRRDDFTVPLTASSKILDRWGTAYREDE